MTETTKTPGAIHRAPIARILRALLPWLFVLAAPVALFRLIAAHHVNIPFLDDWMFVQQFEKLPNGFLWTLAKDNVHLTFHDFFRVQMEHRLAFVRVVVLALHKLWPTDYTKWMWVGWIILVLTYNNIAILLRRTTGLTFRAWWPLLALAGLALFSPLQYRVVLWAMMFQVACPAFFLSSALVVFTSRWPAWLKWIVGVGCATLGTQTLASGLLIWVLPLPLIFWGGAIPARRTQWIFLATWLFVFAITVKLYFTDLTNEEDRAFTYGLAVGEKALDHDTGAFFKEPARSIPYVLRFLGNHLGRGNGLALMDAALWMGTISFGLFIAATLYFLVHFRRVDLRQRLLPWLLFGSYSIACGLLVCIGRLYATTSGDNVLAPRYIVHAVPLTVALIALGWLIGRDLLERKMIPSRSTLIPCTGVAALCLLLVPWPYGCRLMEMWESARLRGASTTLFFKSTPTLDLETDVPCNREHAKKADDLGLLNPPMLKDNRLDNFTVVPYLVHSNSAQWTRLSIETDPKKGGLIGRVQGYASLPKRIRVADGVFLTYKDATDGHWQIFHVEQVTAMPSFLADTISRDIQFVHLHGDLNKEAVSEFTGQFPLAQLPKGVSEVAAWAFDYRRREVYPIVGCFRIDTGNQTVERVKEDSRVPKSDRNLRAAAGADDDQR